MVSVDCCRLQVCQTKSEEECTTVQDRACSVMKKDCLCICDILHICHRWMLSIISNIRHHIKHIFKKTKLNVFFFYQVIFTCRWPMRQFARQSKRRSVTQCKRFQANKEWEIILTAMIISHYVYRADISVTTQSTSKSARQKWRSNAELCRKRCFHHYHHFQQGHEHLQHFFQTP